MKGQASVEFVAVMGLILIFIMITITKSYEFNSYNTEVANYLDYQRECLFLEEAITQTYILGDGTVLEVNHTLLFETEIYGEGLITLDEQQLCPIPSNIIESRNGVDTLLADTFVKQLVNQNNTVGVVI